MDYHDIWQKTLAADEKVEYEFSIGRQYRMFNLFIRIIIGFVLTAPFYLASARLSIFLFAIIILCLLFYYIFYLKVANAYAFTNKRILIHCGWLSTDTTSIDYSGRYARYIEHSARYKQITDTTIVEPFFERILMGSGDLHIDTAGTPGQEVVLKHIDSPYETKKKLENIRHSNG